MPRVWLVTGGSGALGRVLTESALNAGDCVVTTTRRPERLADLGKRHGDRLCTFGHDAVAPEAAAGSVAAAIAAFGRLDVVVNNSGYMHVGSIRRTPLEELETQIAAKLWGPIRVTYAALPVMIAQGRGHIFQTSYVDHRPVNPSVNALQATARALEGFAEATAAEATPSGIHVTIVELGARAAGHRLRLSPHDQAAAVDTLVGSGTPRIAPANVAAAILGAAAEDQPPLRLRPVSSSAPAIRRRNHECPRSVPRTQHVPAGAVI